jgi:hypothetical protein
MAMAGNNYTKAAALLNAAKQTTPESKAWDRRSVAAVVRRLTALQLWR